MSRRPHVAKARLADLDKSDAIQKLGAAREALGRLEAQLRRQSVERGAFEVFHHQIDCMALLLTGHADYYHGKPHRISLL